MVLGHLTGGDGMTFDLRGSWVYSDGLGAGNGEGRGEGNTFGYAGGDKDE